MYSNIRYLYLVECLCNFFFFSFNGPFKSLLLRPALFPTVAVFYSQSSFKPIQILVFDSSNCLFICRLLDRTTLSMLPPEDNVETRPRITALQFCPYHILLCSFSQILYTYSSSIFVVDQILHS